MGLKSDEVLESVRFLNFYTRLVSDCPDDETRFLSVIAATARKKPLVPPGKRVSVSEEFQFTEYNRLYICMSDFIPMMQDIIDTHPGMLSVQTNKSVCSNYSSFCNSFYECIS